MNGIETFDRIYKVYDGIKNEEKKYIQKFGKTPEAKILIQINDFRRKFNGNKLNNISKNNIHLMLLGGNENNSINTFINDPLYDMHLIGEIYQFVKFE
jgi:hypothetical protein